MTGSVSVSDRDACVLAGKFFRDERENFSFLVTKMKDRDERAEGYALYRGASFPISFVRPSY
jgi:hypothetical protein